MRIILTILLVLGIVFGVGAAVRRSHHCHRAQTMPAQK